MGLIKKWFGNSTGRREYKRYIEERKTNPIELGKPVKTDGRHSGNTTRLADYYIQQLFTNQGTYITVTDYFDDTVINRELMKKIIKRLNVEHTGVPYDVDFKTSSIKLL